MVWPALRYTDYCIINEVEASGVVGETILHLPEGFIKGTTGAGDAFCCGVLYCAYYGLGLEAGLKLGAKTAACSLSAEDSNSGVVPYQEIEEVLKKNILSDIIFTKRAI